jgi:hypothetical protein
MYDINRLQNLKDKIESMDKCHQIEILKLLIQSSVIYSENNNGIFINLSDLSDDILYKLEKYIEFVSEQDNKLLNIEKEKDNIKNEFFKSGTRQNIKLKRNKETTHIPIDE